MFHLSCLFQCFFIAVPTNIENPFFTFIMNSIGTYLLCEVPGVYLQDLLNYVKNPIRNMQIFRNNPACDPKSHGKGEVADEMDKSQMTRTRSRV